MLGNQIVNLFVDRSELTQSQRFMRRIEPVLDYVEVGAYRVQVQIIEVMVSVYCPARPRIETLFGITQNWSAKAEYLYVNLNNSQFALTGVPNGYQFSVVRLGVNYTYQTSYRNLDVLDPDVRVPAYGLLNLSAGWERIMGTPIDLELYARNVTNKLYVIGMGNYYYSLGFTTNVYGEPRMFGGSLTYHFGK